MTPVDRHAQALFGLISGFMPQLEMLLLSIIVPFVILGDPLVGTTGFWLTRPISRPTLLTSKALFAAAVIVLPAVLVEVVAFAANRMTPHYIALVVPDVILGKLTLILAVGAIAALTPNFGRFAIAAATLVVVLVAQEFVAGWMRFLSAKGPRAISLTRSCDVAVCLWIIFGGGAVVVHQYLTRKTTRSIVAAAIVALATVPALNFWMWDFMAYPACRRAAPRRSMSPR